MREIKFRAWDKERKQMERFDLSHKDGLLYQDGKWFVATGYDSEDNPIFNEDNVPSRYELMQSTGLRDRNGVEIYEGDIVRWSDSFEERVFCYDLPIIWARGAWYLDTDESRKYPGSDVLFEIVWDEPQNVEVIGNIYENPELLQAYPRRSER